MEHKKKKRILVVDDHEDNIELLRARLEARGYEVEGASDGQAALDAVMRTCPDLILLDVMMPKIDGIEVVRRLKAKSEAKELPFIPVIMQTALDSTENKVEGLDAGADDYITKPINFAELEARVNSLLRIKALQVALAAQGNRAVGAQRQVAADIPHRRTYADRKQAIPGAASSRDVAAFGAPPRADCSHHLRHRQVQGGERQLRPPGRRRGAQGVRAAPQVGSAGDRPGRPLRRGGVPSHFVRYRARCRGYIRRAAAGEGGGEYFYIRWRDASADDELRRGGVAPSESEGPGSALEGGRRRALRGERDGSQSRGALRQR